MIKSDDRVFHNRKYVHLKTGKVIAVFNGAVKIETRDGDIFSCSPNLLNIISKRESESRDTLQKLRE